MNKQISSDRNVGPIAAAVQTEYIYYLVLIILGFHPHRKEVNNFLFNFCSGFFFTIFLRNPHVKQAHMHLYVRTS